MLYIDLIALRGGGVQLARINQCGSIRIDQCCCCCNQRLLIELLSSIADADAPAANRSTAVVAVVADAAVVVLLSIRNERMMVDPERTLERTIDPEQMLLLLLQSASITDTVAAATD